MSIIMSVMDTTELASRIFHLGERFAGIDVQMRTAWSFRPSPDQPREPWRIRLVASKNERSDYRITVTGKTFEEAARRLLDAVEAVDESYRS